MPPWASRILPSSSFITYLPIVSSLREPWSLAAAGGGKQWLHFGTLQLISERFAERANAIGAVRSQNA
jgi:hypothetical protein